MIGRQINFELFVEISVLGFPERNKVVYRQQLHVYMYLASVCISIASSNLETTELILTKFSPNICNLSQLRIFLKNIEDKSIFWQINS